MSDTDRLVEAFSAFPDDQARQLQAAIEVFAARRDFVAAAHAALRGAEAPGAALSEDAFEAGFLKAWAAFSINALANVMPIRPAATGGFPTLVDGQHNQLILLWHYPEYPCVLAAMRQADVLMLTAQETAWMAPFQDAGQTFNFRSAKSVRPLVDAFAQGRNVAAMIDFCYTGTRSVPCRFLGLQTEAPCGMLQLAAAKGYEIRLATYAAGRFASLPLPYSDQDDAAAIAQRALDQVAAEILTSPARWLMWPSLSHRVAPDATAAAG